MSARDLLPASGWTDPNDWRSASQPQPRHPTPQPLTKPTLKNEPCLPHENGAACLRNDLQPTPSARIETPGFPQDAVERGGNRSCLRNGASFPSLRPWIAFLLESR